MAKREAPAAQTRLPAIQKAFVVDTFNGSIRVRKWPRSRGPATNPVQREWIQWFKDANLCAKYSAPVDHNSAIDMTTGTPLYPRDVQIMAMRGRLWILEFLDGKKMFSVAVMSDVSESMDAIGQTLGDILTRGSSYWQVIPAGPVGHVLTSQGLSALPAWQVSGGGGNPYTPPALADFPVWVNQSDCTTYVAPAGPLVLLRPGGTAVNSVSGVFRSMLPFPVSYITGVKFMSGDYSSPGAGLSIYDIASTRVITYRLRWETAGKTASIGIDRWTNPTTYSTSARRWSFTNNDIFWLKISDDGTNFTFYYAIELGAWQPFHQELRNAWCTVPTNIGLVLSSGAAATYGISGSFVHYEQG
jgi:hypothetical protein